MPRACSCQLYSVTARGRCAAVAGPVSVEELAARLIHAFVSVGAEVIPLRLEQVSWNPLRAITVIKIQRGRKRGRGQTFFRRHRHDFAPGTLALLDLAAEEFIEQQIE